MRTVVTYLAAVLSVLAGGGSAFAQQPADREDALRRLAEARENERTVREQQRAMGEQPPALPDDFEIDRDAVARQIAVAYRETQREIVERRRDLAGELREARAARDPERVRAVREKLAVLDSHRRSVVLPVLPVGRSGVEGQIATLPAAGVHHAGRVTRYVRVHQPFGGDLETQGMSPSGGWVPGGSNQPLWRYVGTAKADGANLWIVVEVQTHERARQQGAEWFVVEDRTLPNTGIRRFVPILAPLDMADYADHPLMPPGVVVVESLDEPPPEPAGDDGA